MAFFRKGSWLGIGTVFFGVLSSSVAVGSPTVALINAGTGEKASLRFQVAPDTHQSIEVVWDMSMSMNMGGMDIPMDIPAVHMDFDTTVGPSSDSKQMRYTLGLSKLVLESGPDSESNPMLSTMRTEMKRLVGMKTQFVVNTNGEAISSEIMASNDSPNQMADELMNALSQSLVVFPQEPVGVGAKWSVTEDVDQRGLKMRKTAAVELTERKGDHVQLSVQITAIPLSKTLESTDLPPGAVATITSFDMTGTGTLTYDLRQPLPLHSDLRVTAKTQMDVAAQGQVMAMGTGLDFKVQIRGK